MSNEKPRLIVLTGPTASGKTDLAIAVAQALNGAVVSADSRQVYVGMDIGTAKAVPKKLKDQSSKTKQTAKHDIQIPDVIDGVSHYLFNIRQPDQPLSLSEWQAAAFAAIDTIHKASLSAVLAGGTMLYIDSIVKNYELPTVEPNPALRIELEETAVEKLYEQLLRRDPAAGKFIEPGNRRRIIRALEVMAATNRTFSELRRQRPTPYDVRMIGLFDSWEALEKRIVARVGTMLNDGLIEETQRLVDRYGAQLPLLQTMNYKQALAVIQGTLTAKEALDDMRRANMRYARRQMSWWKNRPEIHWFKEPDLANISDYLRKKA